MIIDKIHEGAALARAARSESLRSIDRSKFMTASEALSCARRQWFQKNGTEPDADYEDSWGYQERGNGVEEFVVDMLERAGMQLDLAWPNQRSLTNGCISGTPDGISGQTALEFKSIDPRTNVQKLPKKEHVVQLQICMELMRAATNHKPKDGVIIYIDASDWSKIREYPVERAPDILSRLTPRAQKILRAKKAKSLEPEGALTGECRLCPFRKSCGEASDLFNEGKRSKVKSRRGSSLERSLDNYADAKRRADEAKHDLDEAKAEITAEMAKRKVQEITLGHYQAVLVEVSGRTSLDKKAVAEAGIDLSPFEKTGATSTRLTVKEI